MAVIDGESTRQRVARLRAELAANPDLRLTRIGSGDRAVVLGRTTAQVEAELADALSLLAIEEARLEAERAAREYERTERAAVARDAIPGIAADAAKAEREYAEALVALDGMIATSPFAQLVRALDDYSAAGARIACGAARRGH